MVDAGVKVLVPGGRVLVGMAVKVGVKVGVEEGVKVSV